MLFDISDSDLLHTSLMILYFCHNTHSFTQNIPVIRPNAHDHAQPPRLLAWVWSSASSVWFQTSLLRWFRLSRSRCIALRLWSHISWRCSAFNCKKQNTAVPINDSFNTPWVTLDENLSSTIACLRLVQMSLGLVLFSVRTGDAWFISLSL